MYEDEFQNNIQEILDKSATKIRKKRILGYIVSLLIGIQLGALVALSCCLLY